MNINKIVDTSKTICSKYFEKVEYVYEIIPNINKIILELDKSKYTSIGENIWIGSNVTIDKFSTIIGPCIIEDNTVIRPSAYIRGNVIIGKNCVIGNSVELKNSIIFDECQIPHYNYIGDSILGYKAHMGAGSIISNLKNDKSNIIIKNENKLIETGMRKMGAIVGDNVDIGCNSVVFPGSIIGNNTSIYPLTKVRGVIESNSIMKSDNIIIKKEEK